MAVSTGVCPYLKREEKGFRCLATNSVVYPSLEKCLVDWWVCKHARKERES